MADIDKVLRQMSNEVTAKTFAFNREEAQKSRDWSEKMSKTSHQMEVEDLKRAGLNPVLSANGGASSYSSSSASGEADNSAIGMMANIYQTKMNNDNAVKLAKLQNKNNLEIARINAAASNYASQMSASASRYASNQSYASTVYGTDRTKYGMIGNFVEGVSGNSSGKSSASKIGSMFRKEVPKANQPWGKVFSQGRKKFGAWIKKKF